MKHITVIPATGGPYRDLNIEPGTTARDIKQALGLPKENVLTKGRGAEPIPEDENLYETLSDGAKLYSTTSVEWGGPFLRWLFEIPEPSAARVQIQRTYSPHRTGISVLRQPLPYWIERGWLRDGEVFQGQYETRFGRWEGWITQSASGRIDTYIANPPSILARHPHWPCFRKRENGWFFIHPTHEISDVSAAILAVEQTLNEAFRN